MGEPLFVRAVEPRPIPEISDALIEHMLSIMRPVALVGHRFRLIETDGVDRRRIAYTWSPRLGRPVRVYRGAGESREIVTFHRCGAPSFFKPSLAETLACIQAFTTGWEAVRFFWHNTEGMDYRNVVFGGSHHWAPCTLFGPEMTDVIDDGWESHCRSVGYAPDGTLLPSPRPAREGVAGD